MNSMTFNSNPCALSQREHSQHVITQAARVGWVERNPSFSVDVLMGFGYRLYPSYNYNGKVLRAA
jgi:hypothetical protein